jgi:hypothetical protein
MKRDGSSSANVSCFYELIESFAGPADVQPVSENPPADPSASCQLAKDYLRLFGKSPKIFYRIVTGSIEFGVSGN